MTDAPLPTPTEHLQHLLSTLQGLDGELERLARWGRRLTQVLVGGGRLLACGNGGSAADAQHLTAELVGRFRDDRRPFSAIALHADTSSLTAIANDYGYEQAFARQVEAHGRPGDVLVAISTSGSSQNVVAAAQAGRRQGLEVWALTGRAPNALSRIAHDTLAVPSDVTATVQEVHGVAIHLCCLEFDRQLLDPAARPDRHAPAPAGAEGGR